MKKILFVLLLSVLIPNNLQSQTFSGEKKHSKTNIYGLVNVSVINMRKTPGHHSELVSQAVMGTPIKILKDTNEHCLIRTPDNYSGWVTRASVVKLAGAGFEAWKNSNRMMFTAKSGIIYADSLKENILSDIVMSSLVQAVEVTANQVKVRLPDQRTGFIDRNQLVDFHSWAKTVQPDTTRLYHLAKKFMGTPYLWGGTSPYMLDCSGFVKLLYFMNGIMLPRDASIQYQAGKAITTSSEPINLKCGDMLFFGNKKSRKVSVTHVGMYLANNEFIHESEWVHINSLKKNHPLYSEHYFRRFVGVRRIISPELKNSTIFENSFYF